MARVMASELSPRGIRVNVVAPGADPHADLERVQHRRPKHENALGKTHCRHHTARPDRRNRITFRRSVLFLASDDAAHVQGQELFVDGGATASPSGAPIYRGE